MKKVCMVLCLTVVGMLLFSVGAFAETPDAAAEQKKILAGIDNTTKELLEEMGVSEIGFDDLFHASPKKIISMVLDVFRGKATEPIRVCALVCAVILLMSVAECFVKAGSAAESVQNFVASLLIIVTLLVPLSEAVTAAVSSVQSAANFMLLYIPIFTGFVSMSGEPITAASLNALMLGLAEGIEQICKSVFMPLIGILLSVNVVTAVYPQISGAKITSFIKRTVTVALSLFSTVFVGVLTTRGLLGTASDKVSIKGIKLLTSNAIPIVGGAIGDAYTSVLSSFSLIKNTVGVFGIVVIALIHLPSIAQLLLWYFALNLCSMVCAVVGQKNLQAMLESITAAVVLVNIIVIFSAFLMIISTGIILSFKLGG